MTIPYFALRSPPPHIATTHLNPLLSVPPSASDTSQSLRHRHIIVNRLASQLLPFETDHQPSSACAIRASPFTPHAYIPLQLLKSSRKHLRFLTPAIMSNEQEREACAQLQEDELLVLEVSIGPMSYSAGMIAHISSNDCSQYTPTRSPTSPPSPHFSHTPPAIYRLSLQAQRQREADVTACPILQLETRTANTSKSNSKSTFPNRRNSTSFPSHLNLHLCQALRQHPSLCLPQLHPSRPRLQHRPRIRILRQQRRYFFPLQHRRSSPGSLAQPLLSPRAPESRLPRSSKVTQCQ